MCREYQCTRKKEGKNSLSKRKEDLCSELPFLVE